MNLDAFTERAAIKEFDGGMSRFQAETEAALEQGKARWQVLNEIRERNSQPAQDHGSAADRNAANDMPGMQRGPEEQNRSMPERDVQI